MKIDCMSNKRLNPLNDYLFLKYMGEKGDEVQLLAFLNAVLHRTGKDNLQSVEIRCTGNTFHRHGEVQMSGGEGYSE
ncbi:hypothetical protein AGMMS49982_09500 [Bacteroidia bacterium]|nr:hypothetical protein AGMMS49982_09500 [Bacteroidia bacterium]